ncbi:MAG: dihydroorotate dehydrogenase electron transfer subunit [Spirochaetaceae bacterium]|nr:dihydroorotate dehydrogenase electron transfer subunit [Spirochaetaceae bacterium]
MKKIETGKLIVLKNIATDLTYLKIKIGESAANFTPGNFVTILPPAASGKYLRRPFSLAGVSDGSIELIIKSIGAVTKSLASLAEGAEIEIMGPLGNSYQIPENIKKLWLIGGGTGIASILFLNSLRSNSMDKVLWAGKTKEALPSMDLLRDKQFSHIFKQNIVIATDDGSAGEKGRAAEVLEQWLEKESNPDGIVSCGPHGMMQAVKKIADDKNIPAWFSLEEFMACGTGACAGCVVKGSANSYLKACCDGPVFKSSEVIL